MDFQEIISKALKLRERYAELELELYGEEWSREEIALGFVGDVGDLMKLVTANEGKRDIDNKESKLAHELVDCLWSIIILANKYDVDLEKSFIENINELEEKVNKEL